MKTLRHLVEKNWNWADEVVAGDPDYFSRLAETQKPKYLWIGCADSRVPPNQVLGLDPGDIFVHRNIANVVQHNDLSLLSVVQYAVEALEVEHVILCGHYGCGGVAASIDGKRHGIVDNWIKPISDLAEANSNELDALEGDEKLARLCELHALAQARNLSRTTILQDAWERGQNIEVHSWVYGLGDGHIKSLSDPITS
ncbi:carbonic anhydrase [Akkermansiaceae bacterium]|nr:carbonic anhydrase [Akkermansiaceae bacterium]